MFTLTGFGDEISPVLKEQLDILESEGIQALELRSVEKKNVADFSDADIKRIKAELDDRGFTVSAIGSPIGKIAITDDFDDHLEKFRRVIEIARAFDTPNIRIFSYYVPRGLPESPGDTALSQWRDEVIRRMKEKARIAAAEGMILLNENEADLYCMRPKESREVIDAVGSPALRTLLDPGNYVFADIRTFQDAYPLLADSIGYVHIKDARASDRVMVPAGEGSAEIPEVLHALKEQGFSGFLSLEPHLTVSGRSSGFTGPEAFKGAIQALKAIVDRV